MQNTNGNYMNPDPMSFRRAVAEEILDTIYFGNLDSIRGAKGRKFSKVKTGQKDAYMLPFGFSKDCYGAVLVHTPNRIEVVSRVRGAERKNSFRSAYDTKVFLCRTFIS
jgi:hypothetical protein